MSLFVRNRTATPDTEVKASGLDHLVSRRLAALISVQSRCPRVGLVRIYVERRTQFCNDFFDYSDLAGDIPYQYTTALKLQQRTQGRCDFRKLTTPFRNRTMVDYRDFIPRQTDGPGLFSAATYESFDAALLAANAFIDDNPVKVLNVETVVLPNLWEAYEAGTTVPSITTVRDRSATRHQFIRIWHER
jgi:hypothetical protein